MNQTTTLITGKASTTLINSAHWIRVCSLGNGCNEVEGGRALPWSLKQEHDADLPLFYVSHTGVQLQNSEWWTKDKKSIAPYGDGAREFSSNSGAADVPANARESFCVHNEVDAEARLQARLPILEVPETIHITHFKAPAGIGGHLGDMVPPTYRLDPGCFHSISGSNIGTAGADTVSVALSIGREVH